MKKKINSKAETTEISQSLNKIALALAKDRGNNEIRIQWAGKLQDAANLVLGATVLAQVLAPNINISVAILGLVFFAAGHWFAYAIMNK